MPTPPRWPLIVLLLAYLAIALSYVVINPVFESPDEDLHVRYIQYLVKHHALPTYEGTILPMRQEASQPPLYYILASFATAWVDFSDFDSLAQPYPYAVIGRADVPGNRNAFIHPVASPAIPTGTVMAVWIARALSVLLGAVVVVCTYFIALDLFPGEQGAALAAATLCAMTPGFVFIAASANNDMLAAASAAVVLALLARGIRRGWDRLILVGLGVAIGVAALAKLNALGVIPLAAGTLMAALIGRAGWRRWRSWGIDTLQAGLWVGGISAVVGGWWYLRNAWLYGDPLATRVHFDVMAARTTPPSFETLLSLLSGVFKSWWGVFGWFNVIYPDWLYLVFTAISLIAVVGVGMRWARERRHGSYPLLIIWTALFLAELIGWAYVRSIQGRLLFPAMPALAILATRGVGAWLPERVRLWSARVALAGLILVAVATPWVVIRPAYAVPAALSTTDLATIPNRVDADYAGVMTLLGYKLETPTASPGDTLKLTLYWRADRPMDRVWSTFVHVVDEQGVIVAQRDQYPGMGSLRTTELAVGQTLTDDYAIEIPKTTFAPAQLALHVGLYDAANGERLPVVSGGDLAEFGSIDLTRRPGEIPNPIAVNFESGVQLAGYDLDRRSVKPGETLQLTLYWRAWAPVPTNFTVFTHIRGEGNALWAGHDGWPQAGAAPTVAWQVGDVVVDPHPLTLAPETPAGLYQIEIGLYDGATGARLRLAAADDRPVEKEYLDLSRIRVAP